MPPLTDRTTGATQFSLPLWRRHLLLLMGLLAQTLYTTSGLAQEADLDELIEFNPPPVVEMNLLIQMVSDELSLNIMFDEQVGSQRVRMLVPEPIPRSSMRGLLEGALQMNGFALIEAEEPGWLRVVEARNLLDVAPPPLPPGEEDGVEDGQPTSALTRVFSLTHGDLQRVEQLVRPFLTEPGGNLQLVPEQRLLIVTDYAPRVERIERVLALIDQPARPVQVRFEEVSHINAAEAANELLRILQARQRAAGTQSGSGQAGSAPLEILPQARTNQLVLIGETMQLEAAVELLASIDVDLGLETRLYRFASVSPGRVDGLVQNLIDPGERDRLYRSSTDEENGLLIVTTTPTIHEQVASIQSDLDREIEAGQPVVRYYKLENASAVEVISTIQELEGITVFSYEPAAPAGSGDSGTPRPGASERSGPPNSGQGDPQDRSTPIAPGEFSPSTTAGIVSSVETEDATLVVDQNTNTIIVLAEEQRQAFYQNIIAQLDRRRPQVMIEITLVALSVSEGESIGVEVSRLGDADDDPRVLSFSNFGLADGNAPADLLAASGLGFNGVVLSEDIANVVVQALRTDGDTEVISAPRILVNDNASGTLASVTDAPFTSVSSLQTSDTVSFGGFESAGTTITVTPQISEGDHLRLAYSIELSTFGEGGTDSTPPPRQRQQIDSEVTIPDGHTVVVGGLRRDDLTNSVSRVPVLGELPVLEYLFSSRSANDSDATLFVFIRPLILRDDDFEDLKYLSRRDLEVAGLPGDYPRSEPLLME